MYVDYGKKIQIVYTYMSVYLKCKDSHTIRLPVKSLRNYSTVTAQHICDISSANAIILSKLHAWVYWPSSSSENLIRLMMSDQHFSAITFPYIYDFLAHYITSKGGYLFL